MAYLMMWQKRKKFIVAVSHEYKETVGVNSIQSSLKSHPLRATL